MTQSKLLKPKIINLINTQLEEKVVAVRASIASSKESRDNDTKSSAGDKFETGREIINTEIQKSEAQLNKLFKLQNDLSLIKLNKKFEKVEFGSLVFTDQFNYFISIPFGKVDIDKEEFYVISLASPLGKQLFEKQVGDTFVFNGNSISVLGVK